MDDVKIQLSLMEHLEVISALGEATGGFEMLILCGGQEIQPSQVEGMKNIVKKLRSACDLMVGKTRSA